MSRIKDIALLYKASTPIILGEKKLSLKNIKTPYPILLLVV